MKFACCLALCTLALTSSARAGFAPVRESTLPNGLVVLVAPDSLAAALDVAVWIRAGSRYEPAGQSGATHLLEGLMFRGSKHVPAGEHQRRIRAAGGTAATFTTSDYSCLYETIPPGSLAMVLRLEADRLSGLAWSAQALSAEKRAIGEAERAGEGVLQRAQQVLNAEVYKGHPYALPASGVPKERDAITLAQLQAYAAARVVPANAVLTIVGRVDPDSALALARRTLGALPKKPVPAPRAATLPVQSDERHATTRADFAVPLLVAGWRAPGGTDTARVAMLALAKLLGNGTDSRLSQKLARVDPPLALATEGAIHTRRESSLLYALVASVPGADTTAIEAGLALEANRLRVEAVSEEELTRVKLEIERDLMLERQTARGRAQALGSAQMLAGDWREAERDLERLRRLRPEDLKAAAARVFKPEQYTSVWMWPNAPQVAGTGVAR